MNVIEKKVHHRQFGDGIITGQTISMDRVQFSEEYGEKRFLYPSAFESFLTLDSSALREKMNDELQAINERVEDERRQREQEDKQRQDEERRKLLEQKQAAVKRRSHAKKTPSGPKAKLDSAQPAAESDRE